MYGCRRPATIATVMEEVGELSYTLRAIKPPREIVADVLQVEHHGGSAVGGLGDAAGQSCEPTH